MRVDTETLEKIRQFSSPELCDAIDRDINLDSNIKFFVGNKTVVGRAYTVDVPSGEGLIVTKAIENLSKGDVLIIAGKGNTNLSYWGDHRSICAKFMKAEAVIIDGAMRDIDGCEEVGFPIFARGICPKTAKKNDVGNLNTRVLCWGILIEPGDIIFGDRNGVLCLKDSDVLSVIERAEEKRKNQEYTISEMFRTGKVLPRIIKRDQNERSNR